MISAYMDLVICMKTINVTFTDEEHEKLKEKLLDSSAVNWHDFILLSAGVINDNELAKKKR